MGYSGTLRSQYRQSGGAAIDNTATRSAFDPTPARVVLFTDIDRQQWGMVTDWAHPSHYTAIEVGDGGTDNSSGSHVAVAQTFVFNLVLPPRVTACSVGAVMSGALNVKITSAVDTVGIELEGQFSPGSAGYDNPDSAGTVWATGVSAQSPLPLSARALKVAATDSVARTQIQPLTVTVKRTDVTATNAGSGGVLWGLIFRWVRQPLNTYNAGADTADSLSV